MPEPAFVCAFISLPRMVMTVLIKVAKSGNGSHDDGCIEDNKVNVSTVMVTRVMKVILKP